MFDFSSVPSHLIIPGTLEAIRRLPLDDQKSARDEYERLFVKGEAELRNPARMAYRDNDSGTAYAWMFLVDATGYVFELFVAQKSDGSGAAAIQEIHVKRLFFDFIAPPHS